MFSSALKFSGFLLAIALVVSCNCKDEVPPVFDGPFYASFTIEGDSIAYQDGVNNYGNGPGISSYADANGTLHSQFTTYIRSALDSTYESNILTIQMVKFLADTNPPSYNTSFMLFDVGAYEYGSWSEDSTATGVDGVVITYTDENEKIWSSDRLYGEQEPWADFEIASHKASGDEQFGAKTKGTFNCRVFDGMGGFKDLRNGSFHARTIYPE